MEGLHSVYYYYYIVLLATMTYNQIQSFQIKDYAKHYVDVKITGCRVLYSKIIAGRGVARFISWLGTVGPVDCFNRVFDCYIRVYQSFSILFEEYSHGPTLGYAPETRHSTNLQDFRSLLV